MSAQLLGPKLLRRISAAAEANVIRGWAHGGYDFAFVTDDHRHGVYSKKTGHVEWLAPGYGHYSTCYTDLWPEHLRAVHHFPGHDQAVRPPGS
jgi:hypothetical protein